MRLWTGKMAALAFAVIFVLVSSTPALARNGPAGIGGGGQPHSYARAPSGSHFSGHGGYGNRPAYRYGRSGDLRNPLLYNHRAFRPPYGGRGYYGRGYYDGHRGYYGRGYYGHRGYYGGYYRPYYGYGNSYYRPYYYGGYYEPYYSSYGYYPYYGFGVPGLSFYLGF